MTDFQALLESLGACGKARAWVGERSLAEAWAECERVDWLRWLAITTARRADAVATVPDGQAFHEVFLAAWQAYNECPTADSYRARIPCPTAELLRG